MSRPVVLNTRPRDQAAEFSAALRAAGFEPLEVPTIEVASAWDATELAGVLARLRADAYQWLVFPSRNAVRFFLEGLIAVGGGPGDLEGVRILSGTGTAEALAEVGLHSTCILTRFSAAGAVEIVGTAAALAPRAADGRDELRGPTIEAPICYRTQPVPAARLSELAGQLAHVDVLTFASPSAVRGLVDGLGRLGVELPDKLIVCLGLTTARAARETGLHVDRVAEQTSVQSLVDAVSAALKVMA